MLPVYLLKRHPVVVEAHFDFVLVLTYAFPIEVLAPLIGPGLVLDTFGDLGFVAVAIVQTRRMAPQGFSQVFGQDYMLIGYRIFVRYETHEGRHLRGLKILRSDTDSQVITTAGNFLTHYGFHGADITYSRNNEKLELHSRAKDGKSSVDVTADLTSGSDYLPSGTPFSSVREALKFAGPMPFTFDYEHETNSIIRVEGVRQNWQPQSVAVEVNAMTFFEQSPYSTTMPRLCSAFHVQDIPYYWKSGIVEKIRDASAGEA